MACVKLASASAQSAPAETEMVAVRQRSVRDALLALG
jgi:hypothetical protein